MNIEAKLAESVKKAITTLYGVEPQEAQIQLSKTKKNLKDI